MMLMLKFYYLYKKTVNCLEYTFSLKKKGINLFLQI